MLHDIRWTSEKLRQRLSLITPYRYSRRLPLPPYRLLKLESPDEDPPIEPNFDDEGWEVVQPNDYWIGPEANFVLRTHFQVPSDWLAAGDVALYLPLGEAGDFSHPEALVHVDGVPIGGCDRHHQEILLSPRWIDGVIHSLALHGWSGGTRLDPAVKLLMRECNVVQIDKPVREFIVLARITLEIADHLDGDNPTRAHLFNALDEAFQLLDTRDPLGHSFYASVPLAHASLRAKIASSGPPLDVDIIAVGHAHIDLAWLWTLGQTRRKAGRTFYNVINLMNRFPKFHFTQSQPQLYEFVHQDYPELFKAIQSRVSEGRWEPIGGMWVEADCNLSGGEALVRQFLLGRSYFRRYFGEGAESPVLWLPDVFGYAWCLPQLMKEAGLDYFFTIKIGWSQYNRFPYDSFWWQGLDGTRILTHFSPTKEPGSAMTSTYNSKASPGEVLSTWTNFQQKDWGNSGQTPPLLMSYGFGNGGGGPTREMVDNINKLNSFPAMPRTRFGTVAEFFSQLESEVGHRLPTWNGELYLEYHRGTYTTQARNKRANRKSEVLLHDVEFLATLAATLDERYRYPGSDLQRAWELVCLNQFHDIIPGSSIGAVYTESLQQYAEVKRIGDKLRKTALAVIAQFTIPDLLTSARIKDSLHPNDGSDLDDVRHLLLVNPTPWPRRDLVFWHRGKLEDRSWRMPDGSPVTCQSTDGGLLLDIGRLGPYSLTLLTADSEHPDIDRTKSMTRDMAATGATTSTLENKYLLVEFSKEGDITRIYDKEAGREVVPSNELANQFQLFEDRPKSPDAWEIDIYYDDKMWLAEPAESIRVVENGPRRAALEIHRHVSNSTLLQRISLAHNSPRLDFDTVIHWHEKHMLLKVAFPVTILSPSATYEIQWGNVQRPTHRNTSWDWARFETCAHKWVDLSEGGYGVSLLNDCKYGHDIHENVIRLTLLRAATDPDPEADQGEHHFAYSLLPHEGSWGELTMAEAYMLNDPVIVYVPNSSSKGSTQSKKNPDLTQPFITVDMPNVIVETIKGAEDGLGIIVRLYESQRRRDPVTLTTAFPLADAWQTNILEENQEQLTIEDNQLLLTIRPYQIMTLRLLPGDIKSINSRKY